MKKFVFAIACLALVSAPLAFAQKKSLVVGMGSADAGKLDPHIASTTPDKGLLSAGCSTASCGSGRARSAPSSSSPTSPRAGRRIRPAREWTFKLRKGVQCHHGYGEFTADDVVYSIKRASNKATSSFSNDFKAFDKVEAPDKYTVKITLKNPVPSLLGLRHQRPRRQHGLQEGRRGDGRELREEADRHRPVHVRRVQAEAIREARRQQAVFPRRAEAREDHLPLHPCRFEPRSRVPVGRARHDLRQAGPDLGRPHDEAAGRQGRSRSSRASCRCSISTSR